MINSRSRGLSQDEPQCLGSRLCNQKSSARLWTGSQSPTIVGSMRQTRREVSNDPPLVKSAIKWVHWTLELKTKGFCSSPELVVTLEDALPESDTSISTAFFCQCDPGFDLVYFPLTRLWSRPITAWPRALKQPPIKVPMLFNFSVKLGTGHWLTASQGG